MSVEYGVREGGMSEWSFGNNIDEQRCAFVQNPDFFSMEESKAQQADFRIRLQYCAQHTTTTESSIKTSLGSKIDDGEKKVCAALALSS